MELTKLEVALLTVPFDTICALVAFGADQAFIWTGTEPRDRTDFFLHLGRMTGHLSENAWTKEIEHGYYNSNS